MHWVNNSITLLFWVLILMHQIKVIRQIIYRRKVRLVLVWKKPKFLIYIIIVLWAIYVRLMSVVAAVATVVRRCFSGFVLVFGFYGRCPNTITGVREREGAMGTTRVLKNRVGYRCPSYSTINIIIYNITYTSYK